MPNPKNRYKEQVLQLKYTAVMSAVNQLLAKKGYDNMTVDEVAELASADLDHREVPMVLLGGVRPSLGEELLEPIQERAPTEAETGCDGLEVDLPLDLPGEAQGLEDRLE